MKYIITGSQHERLFEEEQKVLYFPSSKYFDNDWNVLQKYLKQKGNPPYIIGGDLDLRNTSIQTLGNLISVKGNLLLGNSDIQYLWKLKSVEGSLSLSQTSVETFKFFGDLKHVGGDLILIDTPLSNIYNKKDVRQVIDVGGEIYMEFGDGIMEL